MRDALDAASIWCATRQFHVDRNQCCGDTFMFDGGERSTPGDFRLTVIHILLVAYSPSAYVYLLTAATRAVSDLVPVVNREP